MNIKKVNSKFDNAFELLLLYERYCVTRNKEVKYKKEFSLIKFL
jgi:hypothetical protein